MVKYGSQTGENLLSGIEGELFDIDSELEVSEAESFGFIINGFTVMYDPKKGQLSCGEETADLKTEDGLIDYASWWIVCPLRSLLMMAGSICRSEPIIMR